MHICTTVYLFQVYTNSFVEPRQKDTFLQQILGRRLPNQRREDISALLQASRESIYAAID